ncbi:hypothetical protein F0562_012358 [Nyssa sinensis]|uniref:Uncharacterized protein n=1 Tax=Nyssa sinensis TaxID=561372 RepID=A0A5J4ZW92_9ASTE|nr:hypothetical protein F0562_012358 [Nyssa sinensis]
MRQILRRSLDSPRSLRSPTKKNGEINQREKNGGGEDLERHGIAEDARESSSSEIHSLSLTVDHSLSVPEMTPRIMINLLQRHQFPSSKSIGHSL